MSQTNIATSGSGPGVQRAGASGLTLAAFATVTVLLGMNFVAVRFSNQELMPFWGAGLRFAVASLVLLGVVRVQRLKLPQGSALTASLVYGVLLFGVMYALMYWALLTVSSGMAAVVFASLPLVTLLLATTVKLERLTWRGVAGAILGMVGLGLAFRDQLRADVPLAGLAAVVVAVISAAVATISLKRLPRSHPISANAVAMAVGAGLLLVTSRLAGETWRLPGRTSTWVAVGYLIVSAIVAFVLMVWILGRWDASATTYSSVLQPLVTVVGASLLAGEQVTPLFLIGGALVVGGVYVGALGQDARTRAAPASGNQPA